MKQTHPPSDHVDDRDTAKDNLAGGSLDHRDTDLCIFRYQLCQGRIQITGRSGKSRYNPIFQPGPVSHLDETGVLVLISVFERKVWVLADRGINARVQAGQWDDIVQMIVEGIKQNRQTDAICEAVEKIAELLKTHFPIKPDDMNELKNLIIEE